jgi:hypothetical protein
MKKKTRLEQLEPWMNLLVRLLDLALKIFLR